MGKPKLLDLFCCAGGASMGYYQAGFEVVGVDHLPQPRYPFRFIQTDALEYLDTADLSQYAAIHASPPCQSYSRSQYFPWANEDPAPKLIVPVRQRLEALGKPWVIENVAGSDLSDALQLCGSMFGLPLLRHRWFSASHYLFAPGHCKHPKAFYNCIGGKVRGYGTLTSGKLYKNHLGQMRKREGYYRVEHGRAAMGIEWMNVRELSQAIPPAYTKWVGLQLLEVIR